MLASNVIAMAFCFQWGCASIDVWRQVDLRFEIAHIDAGAGINQRGFPAIHELLRCGYSAQLYPDRY